MKKRANDNFVDPWGSAANLLSIATASLCLVGARLQVVTTRTFLLLQADPLVFVRVGNSSILQLGEEPGQAGREQESVIAIV